MARSRLSRRMEKNSRKNLLLSVLGIILAILLILKFGIPFLVNLSLFMSGSKSNQEQTQNQNPSFITPPTLDPFPDATKSANIIISGQASKNQIINLYINDELIDKTNANDNGRFSFRETISTGEKIIKAKSVEESKESEYSNSIITAFKNAPPSLNITSPTNEQSFTKDQNVTDIKGTTDADARVTVNGFWAITDNAGNFSYRLPLQNGENIIKIISTDSAGNSTEKEIKINYNP